MFQIQINNDINYFVHHLFVEQFLKNACNILPKEVIYQLVLFIKSSKQFQKRKQCWTFQQ